MTSEAVRRYRLAVRVRLTPRVFVLLLLAGLVIRSATLSFRGTGDMEVWKTWSYAAQAGVPSMYGVGGHPPERRMVSWGDREMTVDYPPAALYELAVFGRAYRLFDPGFHESAGLTIGLKLSILLADAILCLCLWRLVRRHSRKAAPVAALFYWLNPATIMDGAVLGYLDPWAGALGMGALLAVDGGAFATGGALMALAILTKLQAVLLAPVAALIVLRSPHPARWRVALRSAGAGLVTVAVVLAPFARLGALPNVRQGVGSLLHHDMLSGDAANLWWIVTWLMRAAYATRDFGAWAAWTMRVPILGVSRVVALGYPNPRPIAAVLAGSVALWALWRARGGSTAVALAAGALIVHAYFVLEVQVHENHFYLALPLMAAAAAMLPRLRAPFYLASAVFATNLFLFYGLGRDFPLPSRSVTAIDATVVLSFVSVGALAWHARRFGSAVLVDATRVDRTDAKITS